MQRFVNGDRPEIARLTAAIDRTRVGQAPEALALPLEPEFLANMSHELRMPANNIVGLSAHLLSHDDHNLTEAQREYLSNIFNSGNQVLLLLKDFLDFTAAASGKFRMGPEPFSPLRKLEEVGSVLQIGVRRKHQVVHIWVGPGFDEVILDPLQFRQVVLNLLSNASKFSSDGARIELRLDAGESDGMVRLRVTDRGIGIAVENQRLLFQPFERLAPRREHLGSGIGLFLTKQLVDAQGGRISVESELGRGTTFTVLLPTPSVPDPKAALRTLEIS
jgi:signal transduction histidine kinase